MKTQRKSRRSFIVLIPVLILLSVCGGASQAKINSPNPDPYISNTGHLFGMYGDDTGADLYPSSAPAFAFGKIGLIYVAASIGNAWTASSNADWIRVLWPAAASGPGWVLYSVTANTGAARTGTMTIAGAECTVSQKASLFFKDQGSFALSSDAGVDGGMLPVDYTCDGADSSPALSWSNAPAGTKEFALMMITLPGDGTTKWSWVLYGIPAGTTSLAKNSSGVGIAGVGSHGATMAYEPPCSQGPGAKLYTFTLYALSASPELPTADQVTGEVLTQAISTITINSASLNLSYTRP